ncbi:uncharacterized protein B0T23DRAFT_198109 [Neurospora hispaniola]|uniref:Uncharacterized protein n=1 Tax=Neurospora hispaniola TaxID=588809 RepID=A0AAJ0MPN8_9PEZI|nr:hypothetical protein B0T23DRAFT_198109 [Neurospora hispaniola]
MDSFFWIGIIELFCGSKEEISLAVHGCHCRTFPIDVHLRIFTTACAFHSMLLSRGRAKSLEPEPVKIQGPKGMPGYPRDHQSVHVRLSANLNGYETGSLSDVGLQTVLDDDDYMFVHAVSGARDDPGNGSSLGDYTRGAALDHSMSLQLR